MTSEELRSLRLIAFFDGRPGHEKQTRGILQALGQKIELQVVEQRITSKNLWADILDVCRLFLPDGKAKRILPEADLLIGTGSRTHIPMLQAKKLTGLPVVTCMTPIDFLRHRFNLIFAPEHDGISPCDNIILTTGPPNCARKSGTKISHRGLILIGGIDEKSHHWHTGDIVNYLLQIAKKEVEVHWAISSSPRTPLETVERLEMVSRESCNLQFFKFEDTGSGWIERQYDECAKVWVTADSMSMVYEALSAGCRVGLLPMRWKKKENKFRRSEEALLQKGMVISYEKWLEGREEWLQNAPLDEANRCAEEILKRWPVKS